MDRETTAKREESGRYAALHIPVKMLLLYLFISLTSDQFNPMAWDPVSVAKLLGALLVAWLMTLIWPWPLTYPPKARK